MTSEPTDECGRCPTKDATADIGKTVTHAALHRCLTTSQQLNIRDVASVTAASSTDAFAGGGDDVVNASAAERLRLSIKGLTAAIFHAMTARRWI